MLRYIESEVLRKKRIYFRNGFNAVLGDDLATNSIGKTSLLLMVDFVFGGNTYAKSTDIIEHLGHHTIKWCIEINDKSYYFSRATQRHGWVNICNESFDTIANQSLNEYICFLSNVFGCNISGLSFRRMVGSFSRIWGRENDNVILPMKQGNSKSSDDVVALVMLYNKYAIIESHKELCDSLTEQLNALKTTAKHDLIPDIGAQDYKDNLDVIKQFDQEIEDLKATINLHQEDIQSVVSAEYIELKQYHAQLILERNSLQERIKKAQLSKITNRNTKTQMNRLVEFFPQLNTEKLAEIEAFHQKLHGILKKEIEKTIADLQRQVDYINTEIAENAKKMDEIVHCNDTSKYAVDRLTTIVSSRQHIIECNDFYKKKKAISERLKEAKADSASVWDIVLAEIESEINQKLSDIIAKLYEEKRYAPMISIKQKSYQLIAREDKGTGTAYINLIAFDLAVMADTCLPFIVHDSILFKNIETPALERLMPLYVSQGKQIFIAIDEVSKFNDTTRELLENNAVIHLAKGDTLYTKDWKNENEG